MTGVMNISVFSEGRGLRREERVLKDLVSDGRVNRHKPGIRLFNTSPSVRAVVRQMLKKHAYKKGGGQVQLQLRNARLIMRIILPTKRARKRTR